MNPFVGFEIIYQSKSLSAKTAQKWFLPCMESLVFFEIVLVTKVLSTQWARKWFFTSMGPHVYAEVPLEIESLIAYSALKWFFRGAMEAYKVGLETAFLTKALSTVRTLK